MAGPFLGQNAVVKKGETEIGYATGITIGMDIDTIKEYCIGDDSPKVFEAGSKSYPVSVEAMCLDTEWASDILNGATCSLEVAPGGTSTGAPKFTIGSVVFSSWELSLEPSGVVVESVSGEGTSLSLGAYP